MTDGPRPRPPRVPPRWFVRLAWSVHRGLYRITRGQVGLWRPRPNGWGALRLTTTRRRTGRRRSVILGYFEDGPNLVSMAMNGWGAGEPAWWLNLQANRDAGRLAAHVGGQVRLRRSGSRRCTGVPALLPAVSRYLRADETWPPESGPAVVRGR